MTDQPKRSLGSEKQAVLDDSLGDLFMECPLGEDHGENTKEKGLGVGHHPLTLL